MSKKQVPEMRSSIKDSKHKQLIIEKQRLQRLQSAGKITEEELKHELEEIESRINFNVQEYIEEIKKKDIVKKEKRKEELKKMSDEKPVKVDKPKRVTNTDLILELLQRKGLKTVAEVVAKFKEKKPEAVEKNVKQQVTEIIAWVKKGHKKYAEYTWDDEAFTLSPKE